MGQCMTKPAVTKQQSNRQKQQKQGTKSMTQTSHTQKTQQSTAKYDQKIINKRQDRINEDQNKVPQLKNKLQLIRNGKYDQAGIKPSNAYFQMIRLQKQIQLYQQKINKSKMQGKPSINDPSVIQYKRPNSAK